MIRASRVRFRYPGRGEDALAGLDLDVGPGEIALISGPTGCGKSTLGMALCGAIPHLIAGSLDGDLNVCGQRPDRRPVRETARDLGLLLQNVEFMTFTEKVDDEIAFGLENFAVEPNGMDALIQGALDRVEAAHLRHRKIVTLSSGERQRVLMAALLALDQRVLVLDEPLAFLDRQAQRRLLAILAEIAQSGRTVLVFEHRRDMLRSVASTELYMTGGRWDDAPESVSRFAAMPEGSAGETLLALDNVAFAWPGDARQLFTGLSFAVRAGESVALLGNNGCGKTTLFRLAMGLLKPSQGTVQTCALDPSKMPPARIAEQTAYIFQQPDHQLYLTTVKDEVAAQANGWAAADREMRDLDLLDLADRHPRSLSMGQKRRVTIAAACARRPKLMLLDEPSVGLDDRSLALVLARLSRHIEGGGAALVATHDQRVADALANRRVRLQTQTKGA
ncbi:ABC transporter ATP-binding protein [Desulfosarcina ovata subsp. sediminis]|uniref:ABC transporter ATP-binding protein n=1 Tax=Desulfosarcina ovata subsp. sediminis TaxID=885957 RepID=A0A5K7ZI87_9BACT|nr:ABC transporter ATP-binding protein [Desulfosarcina ovata]BBO81918.1 ABC transporter ATP-binding protein [Desulfosarcina ovata subsp. sediminis]